MVWETCEVWFVSFYLLSLLSTNVKNVLGHALLTYAPHKTSYNGNSYSASTLVLVALTRPLYFSACWHERS